VEHLLLPWTSFVVLPVFALANAGVALTADDVSDALTSPVALGVSVGRLAGKILGIGIVTWLAVRLGLGRLPDGAGPAHIVGLGAAAGIAFTVSLFVAELAFTGRPELLEAAKVGILASALIAGPVGYAILRLAGGRVRGGQPTQGAEPSPGRAR
jgi:NhaA family Na+:H+ antiporter